jgi:hypothetical protein
MFHFSGEEIAGIAVVAGFVVLYFRTVKDLRRERAVVAGFVVLYFRTVKDLKRERRERFELKKEVSELSVGLLKAWREQEMSALKISEVTEQLDKARREQVEMQEKFVSARCLDVQPGSRAANDGLRSTRPRSEVVEEQGRPAGERVGVW